MTEPLLQAEPALADLAKQLEHWRQTHPAVPDRIPARFWEQAVVLNRVQFETLSFLSFLS